LEKSRKLTERRSTEFLPDRLNRTKRIREIQLEDLRKSNRSKEMDNCTFQPILLSKNYYSGAYPGSTKMHF